MFIILLYANIHAQVELLQAEADEEARLDAAFDQFVEERLDDLDIDGLNDEDLLDALLKGCVDEG